MTFHLQDTADLSAALLIFPVSISPMLVDHILFFSLGPLTALPNSNNGIPSQKTSNSSPNQCSLTYAAASDHLPSSAFEGVIYHYFQLQSYALCQAQMQFQLQKVCFAAALRLLCIRENSCFRELWSVYWIYQSHLLFVKYQHLLKLNQIPDISYEIMLFVFVFFFSLNNWS